MTDNPDPSRYLDNCDRILRVLRDSFEGEFKGFWDGDPILIPASNCPAFVVELMQSQSSKGPTGHDLWTDQIMIKVILNLRDELGNDENKHAPTYLKLKEYVFGRTADGKYKEKSLAGLLRANFTLNDVLLNQNFLVELGEATRPQGIMTAEAHVTISCDYLVERPAQTAFPS